MMCVYEVCLSDMSMRGVCERCVYEVCVSDVSMRCVYDVCL